jgi:hypothetical protein
LLFNTTVCDKTIGSVENAMETHGTFYFYLVHQHLGEKVHYVHCQYALIFICKQVSLVENWHIFFMQILEYSHEKSVGLDGNLANDVIFYTKDHTTLLPDYLLNFPIPLMHFSHFKPYQLQIEILPD